MKKMMKMVSLLLLVTLLFIGCEQSGTKPPETQQPGASTGGGTTDPEGTGGETPDPSNPGGGTTEPGGSGETPDPSSPSEPGSETPVPEFVVEDDKIIFNSLLGIYPDNISERAIVIGYKDSTSNEEINFPYTVDKFTPITEGRYTATELGLKPIEIKTYGDRIYLDSSVKEAWFGKNATLGRKPYPRPENVINTTLEKVKIIDEVDTLVANLLTCCTNIKEIVIPENVTIIEEYAFSECTGLTELIVPSKVTTIGRYAFSNNPNLIKVQLPDSVTSMRTGVFNACSKLITVNIPSNLKELPPHCFNSCRALESIAIPPVVEIIGDSAFQSCHKLTNLIIPETVKTINAYAFRDCRFTSIEIPSKVTDIPKLAFMDCSYLESMTIPVSVTRIEQYVFSGCGALKTINYKGTMEQWGKIGKDSNWNGSSKITTVVCSDGTITL